MRVPGRRDRPSREGHDLLQRHCAVAIGVEQGGGPITLVEIGLADIAPPRREAC